MAGNICRASPSADTLPPLIADGASVKIYGPQGERELILEDFFTGPGQTVLAAEEIVVPVNLTYFALDGCAEIVETVEFDDYVRERVYQSATDEGYRYDLVRAALAAETRAGRAEGMIRELRARGELPDREIAASVLEAVRRLHPRDIEAEGQGGDHPCRASARCRASAESRSFTPRRFATSLRSAFS